MFNKVTSQNIEKEVQSTMAAFTSTVSKLKASSEKARNEANAKREEIKNLTLEAKALDEVASKAEGWADKIESFFN